MANEKFTESAGGTYKATRSDMGGVIDNHTDPATPNIVLKDRGAIEVGPGVASENDGTNRYQFQKGTGSEGPGRGSAVRLNSDDQMPGGPQA